MDVYSSWYYKTVKIAENEKNGLVQKAHLDSQIKSFLNTIESQLLGSKCQVEESPNGNIQAHIVFGDLNTHLETRYGKNAVLGQGSFWSYSILCDTTISEVEKAVDDANFISNTYTGVGAVLGVIVLYGLLRLASTDSVEFVAAPRGIALAIAGGVTLGGWIGRVLGNAWIAKATRKSLFVGSLDDEEKVKLLFQNRLDKIIADFPAV